MVKILSLVLLIGMISGCNTLQTSTAAPDKTLITITAQCPVPPEIVKPYLPIMDLSEADKKNPNKVGKAYVESVKILQDHADGLEILLDGYR